MQSLEVLSNSKIKYEYKEYGNIYETHAYNLFSFLDGNRQVKKLHLKRLIKAMEQKQLIIPILVNEDFQIIDGQHRYLACKELGLPLYYYIVPGYELKDVQIANTNMSNWSNEDYLSAYIDLGIPEYIEIKNLMGKYKLSLNSVAIISTAGAKHGHNNFSFKGGDIQLLPVDARHKGCFYISSFKPYFKKYQSRNFVKAIKKILLSVKDYDQARMNNKLEYQREKLVACTNTTLYLKLLEEIYNYKSQAKNYVRFI